MQSGTIRGDCSDLAFCGALRLSCGVLFGIWYLIPCAALRRVLRRSGYTAGIPRRASPAVLLRFRSPLIVSAPAIGSGLDPCGRSPRSVEPMTWSRSHGTRGVYVRGIM